jgi:ubiquinone/menaquinone biosynthesis C-methylase UbiE
VKNYEQWWEKNVVSEKYYTVSQFKDILGCYDSRRVYSNLIPKTNKRVLDVGCGLGLDYEFYLKNDVEVEYFGVDICCGFIEHNKKEYPGTNFVCGKSYELPFKDKAFGLTTTRHVLEHLKEPYSTIHEMCRVSDRVAIIWFIAPGKIEQTRLTRKGFYKNTYSESELMRYIEQLGFRLMVEDIRMTPSKKHTLWFLTR